MNTPDKNIWIDETMASLEGMQTAQAPHALFGKIQNRLNQGKIIPISQSSFISLRKVSIAAAIIIVLFSVNFYIAQNAAKPAISESGMDKLVKYYQLSDNNPLYNL